MKITATYVQVYNNKDGSVTTVTTTLDPITIQLPHVVFYIDLGLASKEYAEGYIQGRIDAYRK